MWPLDSDCKTLPRRVEIKGLLNRKQQQQQQQLKLKLFQSSVFKGPDVGFLLCPCDSEFHLNASLDLVVPSFEATPPVRKPEQEGEGFVRTTCLL